MWERSEYNALYYANGLVIIFQRYIGKMRATFE